MAHCVPDFNTLSHPLHKICRQFPASTPGPGFYSTPPITNRTAKVAAHRSMLPIVLKRFFIADSSLNSMPNSPSSPGTHAGSVVFQVAAHFRPVTKHVHTQQPPRPRCKLLAYYSSYESKRNSKAVPITGCRAL
jgi:hypothetical protein